MNSCVGVKEEEVLRRVIKDRDGGKQRDRLINGRVIYRHTDG